MIETVVDGDILTAETEALVCPVNCVGVIRGGTLSHRFMKAFPRNMDWYVSHCNIGKMKMGEPLINDFRAYQEGDIHRYIVHFPVRNSWRDNNDYSEIDQGLSLLGHLLETDRIRSIAIPSLGSEAPGKLRWGHMKEMIEAALGSDFFDVIIYEEKEVWGGFDQYGV